MQLVRRFRIPAIFCALAVLFSALISRPYSSMGFVDDWPYILSARTLAATGHIIYNGWAAPILGWHLYLGAAFIKIFGYSLTTARMAMLTVGAAMAFVIERILVRCGITERNATIGTLALVLSPLYLILSVTFMTDISGLFSVVLCFYGCLRALQASTSRTTIAWLSLAVAINAVCGTSRQIEWLGVLVMVPSALWLLHSQRRGLPEYRRIVLSGAAANLLGVLFIFACMHWFAHQPYTIPEHLLPPTFPIVAALWQLTHGLLDLPFLLLPIVVPFLFVLRKSKPWVVAAVVVAVLGYLFLSAYPSHLRGNFPLEPTMDDWVNIHGVFPSAFIQGTLPRFVPKYVQLLLTVLTFSGLLSLIALILRPTTGSSSSDLRNPPMARSRIAWGQLLILTMPFAVANILIVIPRAATYGLTDRYLLGILVASLPCLVRCYQDLVQPRLPFVSILLVALMALFAVTLTHHWFSFYRARVALVAELSAAGVPPTSVDNGWEYNVWVELQHAPYINNVRMVLPAHAYVPTPPPPPDHCPMSDFDAFPHIHPLYGISFTPDACYGRAPFAPVHYSRWPYRTPGTLYVVRYLPPPKS